MEKTIRLTNLEAFVKGIEAKKEYPKGLQLQLRANGSVAKK